MNKQQFYTFGSALLATSALATTAMAGTIGIRNTGNNGTTTSTIKIANTLFATTASTANALVFGTKGQIVISFANNFSPTSKFGMEIDVTGAKFSQAAQPNISILTRATAGSTFTGSQVATGLANCAIQVLADKITLDNCQISGTTSGGTASAFAGGIELSGVLFSGGAALATAGSTISLTAYVYNGNNPSQHFEDILTPATVITSAVPFTGSVTQTTTATADPLTSPTAFTALSGSLAGSLSVTIATVLLTSTGAFNTDLATLAKVGDAAGSATITITSGVLTSASTTTVSLATVGGATLTTVTTAAFAGGTLTFNVASVSITNTFVITAQFDGKNAISAVAANSTGVVVTFGTPENTLSNNALAPVTGTTVAINRGGFSGQANTVLSSANSTFTSFIRIHNNGATSGIVTIAVLNDATGAALGSSFSSATIAAGQTLQLSAGQIETGAGITAVNGTNYTVNVTGQIIGYIQHIIYNASTGQLADLSSFRNANSTSGNP